MIKIVGNILGCCLLIFTCAMYAQGSVQLKATTLNGSVLTVAGVGHPFLLEVTATGMDMQSQAGQQRSLLGSHAGKEPIIKGVDTFYVREAGVQLTTLNGVSSMTRRYKVRIDQPGTYTVGPAEVENKGSSMRSNTIAITVAHQEKAQEETKEKKIAASLKLSADKQRVVVGEKISCRLRFSFKDDGLTKLQSIGEGEISGFTIGKKTGPEAGTENLNGEQHAYGQWCWEMYAKQPGDLVLPPYSADLNVRSSERERHPFAFFFGDAEQKRIFSNALKIHVDPLPAHDDTVDGVGLFTSYTAKVDHAVAKEGEGIVFALEIEGDADLENLGAPTLQKIPTEFKWYESKNAMCESTPAHNRKKRFEYIMQGLKAGTYEIPPQTFTYFDVRDRNYKTLETASTTVTIKPNFSKHMVAQAVDTDATVKPKVDDDLRPLDKHNVWHAQQLWYMPWWLLVVLVAVPFGFLGTQVLRAKMEQGVRKGKKYAIAQLKNSLTQCARMRQYGQLYQLFVDFFAQKFDVAPAHVTAQFMHNQLREMGYTDEQLAQWDLFYIAISSLRFYGSQQVESELLIKQANHWCALFEEKL